VGCPATTSPALPRRGPVWAPPRNPPTPPTDRTKPEETGRSRPVPLGAGAFQSCFAPERTGCSRSAPLRARQGVENLTRAAPKTARNEFATVSVANPTFARVAVSWLLGLPPMWWQTPQSLLPASPLFGFPPSRGRGAASGGSTPPHDGGNAERNPARSGSFPRSPPPGAAAPHRPCAAGGQLHGPDEPKETGPPFESCFPEAHPPAPPPPTGPARPEVSSTGRANRKKRGGRSSLVSQKEWEGEVR